jgi:hypothetical protein
MPLKPRNILFGTRAEGQLLRMFWARYLQARHLTSDEKPFGSADAIFEEPVLTTMRQQLSGEALSTPVLFTEKLSNRVLAGCLIRPGDTCLIAINSRFRIDPEIMAHTLVEEFAHVQQRLDGMDFEIQRRQFSYQERPCEQEAKRIATQILGYEPEEYETNLLRDEPDDVWDAGGWRPT